MILGMKKMIGKLVVSKLAKSGNRERPILRSHIRNFSHFLNQL